MQKTYLERIMDETLRPIIGALELLEQEITETMQIPDAPWKILNKSYGELTEQEVLVLMDVYHQDGETTPCPMCRWTAREELHRMRLDKEIFGG